MIEEVCVISFLFEAGMPYEGKVCVMASALTPYQWMYVDWVHWICNLAHNQLLHDIGV